MRANQFGEGSGTARFADAREAASRAAEAFARMPFPLKHYRASSVLAEAQLRLGEHAAAEALTGTG